MSDLRSLGVYCGSSPGARPVYAEAAWALGTRLAREGIRLVTGGGKVGLMGVVADAVLEASGEAVGVIPQPLLDREVGHEGMSELHVVGSMHERKALIASQVDAVVALPGGMGTLEEITEMLTWAQLGLHAKPCALFNVAGYYDALVAFLDHAVEERFLRAAHREMLTVAADVDALLDGLRGHVAPGVAKWMDRGDG